MEVNDLLPQNQHGFRAGRSTMSALAALKQEWSENTEKDLITGILLWDLSAAFDTLSAKIMCSKPSYPLNIEKMKHSSETRITRSVTSENLREPKSKQILIGDATRLWNKAPNSIKQSKSIGNAKK